MHSSNYRSVIPTDTQALTALQNLLSDDFEAKNTHSIQRKGEETPDTTPDTRNTPDTRSDIQDEAFQLIEKIHNQLQDSPMGSPKAPFHYISIRFLILQTPGKYSSRFNSTKRINILNPLIH